MNAQDVETLVKQQPRSGRPRGGPSGGVAMNSATFEIATVRANAEERVRAIRFRLPRQAVMERVAETLPTRIGYVRSTVMEPIEEYRRLIPDEVLLKYDDAQRSGLFAKFSVVTPT